jgi:hypothetical protein
LPHDLKLPSFIETNTVDRYTFCSIGGVTTLVALAIAANDCASTASRYISTLILPLSEDDRKTSTKLSEILYRSAVLVLSCCFSIGAFVSLDEFVLFVSISRTPVSLTLSW